MTPIVQHVANHARLTTSTRFSGSSSIRRRAGSKDKLDFIPIEDSGVRFLVALEIGRFDPRA
jgi:hypothetical protein